MNRPRRRTFWLLLIGLLFAGPHSAFAAIISDGAVNSIEGIWTAATGGPNVAVSGLGTNRLDSGTPLPGSIINALIFDPAAVPVDVLLNTPFLVGTLTVQNGSNEAGTSATSATLQVTVRGLFGGVPFDSSDSTIFNVINTPNSLDDPIASADRFVSPLFTQQLAVKEQEVGSAGLYGVIKSGDGLVLPLARFAALADPPLTFELVGFGPPVTGGAFLEPNPAFLPEPSSVAVWGCLAAAAALGLRLRKRSA